MNWAATRLTGTIIARPHHENWPAPVTVERARRAASAVMQTRRALLQLGAAASGVAAWRKSARRQFALTSPNGRVCVTVELNSKGEVALAALLDGQLIIGASSLGLDLKDGGPLASGLQVSRAVRSAIHSSYVLVCGKTRDVDESAVELALDLQEISHRRRKLRLIIRAFDHGFAFRYDLPAPQAGKIIAIRAELTRFDFPQDFQCWGLDLGAYDTSHEGEFQPFRASQLQANSLLDAPLICTTAQSRVTSAIAEADLTDYASLYFTRRRDAKLGVQIQLSPRLDDPAIAVRGQPGHSLTSPWRVVMMAENQARLIESTLITTLSQPSQIADTGWIRPGKAAWDWWSGAPLDNVDGPRMSNATMMRLIDFAAANGLQYLLIDAGWYAGPDSKSAWPKVDVTRSVPEIDLPALVQYGRQRDIGLFVWLNWRHLDAQMATALSIYRQIGLKGIKVDFMNRDDQEMMAFYHRLLAAAASQHLMVDLHGATHPTGLGRTYPNLMTQEAVMGAEYNKWTRRVTARHNVTLPFTRMLLGPMDYTPGGFRNVAPERFEPREQLPLVQTTRGQALAMYVVYDSPFACVSDSPDTYKLQSGLDFLASVPTSWDECRALAGEIGQYIVLARRKDRTWFVGAMTDAQARVLAVPLSFLGQGRFMATIYADGDGPALLDIRRDQAVSQSSLINLAVAANGGGVIVVEPSD